MTILTRIWPKELEIYRDDPRAVPMASGPYERLCANCGGMGVMMVYLIEGGPYSTPNGGKVKWLDLPPDAVQPQSPRVSGWYSGRMEVAPCPVCAQGRMDDYLRHNCGLREDDLEISLQNFKVTGLYAGKKRAREVAGSLLAQNERPRGFVTFTGDYGVGKSHLLKALVNGFRQVRVVSRYSTMADLMADLRDRFGEDRGGRAVEEAIDDLRQVRVLAIDELDRVNLTGWAKETMFRLLNSRYEERERLLTVMATNLSPQNLPPELGYLSSRFTAGVIVEVPGPDVRPALGVRAEKALEKEH